MPDDQPVKKIKNFIEKLNAYRNLLLALAALVTAIGSWYRPTDNTATEKTYNWTAQKIEELSQNDAKAHADIIALRNYLEGYVNGQRGRVIEPPVVISRGPASSDEESNSGSIKIADTNKISIGVIPKLSPTPKAAKKAPTFGTLMKKD